MQWLRDRFAARRRPEPAVTAPAAAELEPAPPLRGPSAWEWARYVRSLVQQQAEQAPSVDALQRRDAADYEVRNAAGVEHITRGIARRGVWFPGDD